MPKGFWAQRLPLLEVLLLLLLIIGSIVCYGLAGSPFLLNEEIRQADVKSLFERKSLVVSPLDTGYAVGQYDSALIAAQVQEDETVDSSSKYILFCGDSMTEQTRYALEKYAAQNGHKLITCTWYSSTTKLWSETDRLSILIKEYKPDIIWFTLGANELFMPGIASREKYIEDIIQEADTTNTPFVWIGPPNWKDDTGINELIAKHLGPKRFYSSAHFRDKLKRGSDGAHPTRAAAAIWTDSIAAWYVTESLYKNKILLQDPKDTAAVEPLVYLPLKETCAPARNNKWGLVILKATHQPQLCKEDENLLATTEPPEEPSTPTVTQTNTKTSPPTKIDTTKTMTNNNPKIDTTPKTKVTTIPKDSTNSKIVPGDLPIVPKDSL